VPDGVLTHLAEVPLFLASFGLGIALLAIFSYVYTMVTPYHELSLIRRGNLAAGLSYAGALLGYTLPLAVAILDSAGLPKLMAWGGIALAIQLLVLAAIRLALPDLFRDIRKGKLSAALLHAAISVSAGILNAAAAAAAMGGQLRNSL